MIRPWPHIKIIRKKNFLYLCRDNIVRFGIVNTFPGDPNNYKFLAPGFTETKQCAKDKGHKSIEIIIAEQKYLRFFLFVFFIQLGFWVLYMLNINPNRKFKEKDKPPIATKEDFIQSKFNEDYIL